MSSPDSGTRAMLASGPTRDALPKVAAKSGQRAAVMTTLAPARIKAPRTARGQCRGTAASSRGAAASRAAQAATLINAPGERAASGLQARMSAAARVSAAEVELCRSSRRAKLAAASMSQARRLGGSAPTIKV